jgi:bacillithiol system protein YtxJ
LRAPLAVVFKHSTRCGISSSALIEVRQFAVEHPEIPVFLLDVIADRALARRVAARLGVRHESPQALVLGRGRVLWHGSHSQVSLAALEEATRGSAASPDEVTPRLPDSATRG